MTKIDIEAMRERIKELCEMYSESSEGALDLEKELLDLFLVMLSESVEEMKKECIDITINEDDEYISGFSCGIARLTATMEGKLYSA